MAKATRKKDFDYFDYFCQCAQSICQAAAYLHESLSAFEHDAFLGRMDKMHQIENQADCAKHDMTQRLVHEFITPIEREDIFALAQQMDNVVDAIDDVMRRAYMYDLRQIRPDALKFTDLIVRCTQQLSDVLCEFRNFKTSPTIREKIVAVNTLESDGDMLHARCYHELYANDSTPTRTLMVWSNMFEDLESCLDACEDAVDIIESVIMKNT